MDFYPMMKWGSPSVLVLAAAASVLNVILFKLENLMATDWSGYDQMLLGALGAVAILTVVGLVQASKLDATRAPRRLLAFTALVIVAGFTPRMIVAFDQTLTQTREAREKEVKRTDELGARKADVEARIAAGKAYSPDEAMEFIKYIEQSGHPPYNTQAIMAGTFALLERALASKVIDPNMIVKDRFRADLSPGPLFIHYHRWIRQDPKSAVRAWDWRIMVRLARDADLSRPEAARAAADMRKTATPLYDGLYFDLK